MTAPTSTERAIRLAVEKERKAFGGCLKCYGKGYNTVMTRTVGTEDFGGEGFDTGSKVNMEFCDCERGKQLSSLLTNMNEI